MFPWEHSVLRLGFGDLSEGWKQQLYLLEMSQALLAKQKKGNARSDSVNCCLLPCFEGQVLTCRFLA
jgi:hypothetical protein